MHALEITMMSVWRRIIQRRSFWSDQYYSFGRSDLDHNLLLTLKRLREHTLLIIVHEFKAFYATPTGRTVFLIEPVGIQPITE